MTPFAEAVRLLRERKGVTQKEMAAAIGVSPAYLSALEHGKRGKPSFDLLQRIAGYFNIIWDEAEELFFLMRLLRPQGGDRHGRSAAAIYGFCQSAGAGYSQAAAECDRGTVSGATKKPFLRLKPLYPLLYAAF